MRFLGLYILLFIFLEVISIAILSSTIGWAWELACVIAFFLQGIYMFKKQGKNLQQMFENLRANKATKTWYEKIGPIRYSGAALLFMSPGMFSNILAIIVLFSSKNVFSHKISSFFSKTRPYESVEVDKNIIEGEFREIKGKKEE